MLTAVRPTDERNYCGAVIWEFKCDCGNSVFRTAQNVKYSVTQGFNPSCGCRLIRGREIKDVTGQRFGMLTAVRPTDERNDCGAVIWEFKCDCGNTVFMSVTEVKGRKIPSCGCEDARGRKIKDVTGRRFGMLTAVRPTDERKNGYVVWEWRCDCGNAVFMSVPEVKRRKIPSCGCRR